jgi:hypothetical protein
MPIASNLLQSSDLDSLLVLLQNLNGNFASLNRWTARAASGVGDDPICSVPERSISRAAMRGRLRVGDIRFRHVHLLQDGSKSTTSLWTCPTFFSVTDTQGTTASDIMIFCSVLTHTRRY